MLRTVAILLISALLLSGLCSPTASGEPPADAVAKELKALAGTWRPVSAMNNGFESSEADLKGIRWIREPNGKWAMQRDGKTVLGWAVKKIDATKKPKTIDIEVTTGDHKGTVYQGIYEIDGDKLRICFALPDRTKRPTELSAGKGSVCALSSFKREKK